MRVRASGATCLMPYELAICYRESPGGTLFKKILIVVAVILVVLVIAISMQPATYLVTRSTTIAAPPEKVFPLVNDFHQWDNWSPWAKLDPSMKTTFEGPPAGPGAIYSWTGNDKVGSGKMTITDSHPTNAVSIRLEFIKPFASVTKTDFQMTPAGQGTAVQWTMAGDNNFVSKAMCLFLGGMDKMIGPDFDRGLTQMKAAAERR